MRRINGEWTYHSAMVRTVLLQIGDLGEGKRLNEEVLAAMGAGAGH